MIRKALLTISFTLILFSCTKETNQHLLLQDILFYNRMTEKMRNLSASQIEMEGNRSLDVESFRKLDSCFLYRKKLFEIDENKLRIKSSNQSDYINYLEHLEKLRKIHEKVFRSPYSDQALKLKNESKLWEVPSEIDVNYILKLSRYEYQIIDDYFKFAYPLYCGWATRVYNMQSTSTFSPNDTLDVVLISDYATNSISEFRIEMKIDSITNDNERYDVVEEFKVIDRVGYLRMTMPKKGLYGIHGTITNSWNHESDSTYTSTNNFYTVVKLN